MYATYDPQGETEACLDFKNPSVANRPTKQRIYSYLPDQEQQLGWETVRHTTKGKALIEFEERMRVAKNLRETLDQDYFKLEKSEALMITAQAKLVSMFHNMQNVNGIDQELVRTRMQQCRTYIAPR